LSPLSGITAAVLGAGAFGLASALRLQLAGAAVQLFDPSPIGDSASGVAAGMLAPGLETLLDPASSGHYALLSRARDLWPELTGRAGADPSLIDRSGAVFVADTPEGARELAALAAAEGVPVEAVERAAAEALTPGLRLGQGSPLYLPGEWRLAPQAALAALADAFQRAGGRIVSARAEVRGGRLTTAGGEAVAADLSVIASGAEAVQLAGLVPVLGRLEPIKGQILELAGGPRSGAIVRTPRAYVAPQPGGALIGATMERGVADRRTDPEVMARLRSEGERLFPELAGVPGTGRAGVRASSPDGLPLAGRFGADGTILAVGARRNGWLLAPLVAELVLATALGDTQDEAARLFAPERFLDA
jgi:glycine oxidase